MCTSNEFADDILQPLALERFADYANVCTKHFPLALRPHHYFLMHERWIKCLKTQGNEELARGISPRCAPEFYVHRNGDIENCTFIAISEVATDDEDYFVFPFSLQKSGEELDQCFRQTKRIKWTFGPLIASMQSNYKEGLFKFMNENGLVSDDRSSWPKTYITLSLSKEKATTFEYELPADIYVAPLNSDHAILINKGWAEQSSASLNFIRSMLVLNADGCFGLFDKNTNEVLSYVGTLDNLCIGLLHTVKSARGRGLGKLTVKMYCKEFVKRENLDLLAFIFEKNEVSMNLFKSLGFAEAEAVIWTKLKTL